MDLVFVGSLWIFPDFLDVPKGRGGASSFPLFTLSTMLMTNSRQSKGWSKCCLLTPCGRWGTVTSLVSAETQRVSADSKPSASKNQVFRAQRWDQIFTSITPVFVALDTTDIIEIIYISNCFYFLESLSHEPLFLVTRIPLYPVSSCGRGLFVGIFLNYAEHPPPRPTLGQMSPRPAQWCWAKATGSSALFFFFNSIYLN